MLDFSTCKPERHDISNWPRAAEFCRWNPARPSCQHPTVSVFRLKNTSGLHQSAFFRNKRVEVGGRGIGFPRTLKRRWRLFSADKVWICSCLTSAEATKSNQILKGNTVCNLDKMNFSSLKPWMSFSACWTWWQITCRWLHVVLLVTG